MNPLKITSLLLVTLSLLHAPLQAGSDPISSEKRMAEVEAESSHVFLGEVIAYTTQWTSGSQQITEQEAKESLAAYDKFLGSYTPPEFMPETSEESSEQTRKHWETFFSTIEGKRWKAGLSCVKLVTVSKVKIIKGSFPENINQLRFIWTSSPGDSCHHVIVPCKVSDTVRVYLNKPVFDDIVIIEPKFRFGRPTPIQR